MRAAVRPSWKSSASARGCLWASGAIARKRIRSLLAVAWKPQPSLRKNGDLIAYWRPDEYDPDDLVAVAVDLRNASKHLAPVIAAMPQALSAGNN